MAKNQGMGGWSSIIGVALAIIAGFIWAAGNPPWVTWVLVILGLIIGFMNVQAREVQEFLIAVTALVIVAGGLSGLIGGVADWLKSILGNFVLVAAPAGLVVSIKTLWALAKD